MYDENTERLSEVFPVKPVPGQNIALHAWPAVRKIAFLTSALPVQSTSFFYNPLFRHKVICVMNNERDSYLWFGHSTFPLIHGSWLFYTTGKSLRVGS